MKRRIKKSYVKSRRKIRGKKGKRGKGRREKRRREKRGGKKGGAIKKEEKNVSLGIEPRTRRDTVVGGMAIAPTDVLPHPL